MKTLLITTMLVSALFAHTRESRELTPENVYAYCVEQDIAHPEIVTAQAILETGWLDCTNCCLDKNNIFGFYYKGSYLSFDTWEESVEYYKRWQEKRYHGERDYYDFLACLYKDNNGDCIRYAANPSLYNSKLKSIVSEHSDSWIK